MTQIARLNAGPTCTCCGRCRRGVVYVDTPAGPYGIAICPACDYAHHAAAGPPPSLEHRARDFPDETPDHQPGVPPSNCRCPTCRPDIPRLPGGPS